MCAFDWYQMADTHPIAEKNLWEPTAKT